MLLLQSSCRTKDKEELGAVGVGPCVSHGQHAWPIVPQFEVLISKLLPIDGFASSAIVSGKVPTLNEANRPVESKIHFSLQITLSHKRKVCCFSPYLHNDPATSFAANADVEVDAGVCHFCG
uniref:Uncharacterized protein n=1 Tax=Mola mola TaxID=94237 RepID=A0A3Q3WJT3_MOLML